MTKNKRKADKKQLKKQLCRFFISLTVVITLTVGCLQTQAFATGGVNINVTTPTEGSFGAIELMFMLMLIALAPSLLMLMTSFTRIIIVLSLLRSAMGTQQSPPNQVLIGLALFLTLFIMTPTLTVVNDTALQPYFDGQITQEVAIENAITPLKSFMAKQVKAPDVNLFLSISGQNTIDLPENATDDDRLTALESLDLTIIVPAFITSELKRAFTIGFLLYLPFLIIDMVVSSTLMSMGMVMLPPSTIALPFKLMMFVLVDGWGMLFGTLVQGFHQ